MSRVLIFGFIAAVITAVLPVVNGDFSWYSIAFSGGVAGLSYLTRNMKGQIASILGVITAAAYNFYVANPAPPEFSWKYLLGVVIFPLLLQLIGAIVPIGDKKE